MRSSLATMCSRFIENRDIVKSTFVWDSTYMYPICAAIITEKGMRADPERLRNCRELLKDQTGVFSDFRSTAKLPMIAMMSVDSNPSSKLKHAIDVYERLKEHFWGSQYLPVASMAISDMVDPGYYKEMASHTRHIYNLLKSKHPFLTSAEDSVFSAMLAVSRKTDERIVAETEACYRYLKPHFFSGNAVQSLSHVLALCEGSAEEKSAATLQLFNELKARGYKYGTEYELATLGILAMLPADKEMVIQDLIEVDDFLANQKGYGFFGLGRKQRLMHAGLIVTGDYLKDTRMMHTTATHSALALIAAQQAAMCAAIAASSAAAASSTSSGGN